ncbi:MAG: helix-turn-helix domain-containing protein [Bacteroidetes bacterium]|nr:helix-turn-helix domain-containing protein [Bacteroidota bacterium]
MTANQVASYLGLEAKTIRNWNSDGTIPHKKIGGSPRYLKSEIDEGLKKEVLGRKKPGKVTQAKPKKS